jgi:uncharacterized delta-60 repeat protein
LAIQADGKIVAAGVAGNSTADSGTADMALVRYNHDGSLDSAFGSGGKSIVLREDVQSMTSVAVQSDGKIVVGGTWLINTSYRHSMAARFDINGNLDATFGDGGIALWDVNPAQNSVNDELLGALAIQADGKIVLAGAVQPPGATTRSEWAVTRLLGDGPAESPFASDEIWTDQDFELALSYLFLGDSEVED